MVAGNSGIGDALWSVSYSDERLKDDIRVVTPDALSDVEAINFIEFKYKLELPWQRMDIDAPDHPETAKFGDGKLVPLGVSAQQLNKINPNFVDTEGGTWWAPRTDILLWYALRSIQQLSAEVTELRALVKPV
jgi:hypothetical protein